MKSGGNPSPRQGGFVLVVALGALALMMILLVAILQGARDQGRGAETAAIVAREKMLADSAASLVIGQIQLASTQSGVAWISQPGLLRTYSATASRQPLECYKLYSAASLTDSSGNLNFLSTDIPANWNSASEQNLYVDLNEPQMASFFGTTIYPILDPLAFGNIEGLSSDTGAVTMPVMWLYELQDGTLGPAANATASNPIVGRIAFWTDDETSKININTAGDGSPWNTPRVNSTDDVAWATTQPAVGEFSRYPGHPAMTSLFPVFDANAGSFTAAQLLTISQQLLGMSPRYAWGGSQGGTTTTTAGQAVAAKSDRIYGSVDELCFGTSVSANQRVDGAITPAQLEQAKFVLTAHSNAPETTLLGEPRVAIWPVSDAPTDSTRTTATDRAIEMAATVGTPGVATTRDYFFQRNNPAKPTDDFDTTTTPGKSNVALFNELLARGSEKLPGYGTSFIQKYPGAQWIQLLLEMTDFIHGLNSIDPSGGSFIPFAGGDATTRLGRAFVVPLTTVDSASGTTLRGFGRCPTLSSLTLVIYVSGFGFDDGTTIDFDPMSGNSGKATWLANFDLTSATNRWKHVTSELLRAFVVPCTFHPGCAFPEVSDACDLKISGLNNLTVSVGATSGNFGFAASANSALLGNPLSVLPADRAWGGNEGPLAWRATGDALANGSTTATYPFAGTTAFQLPPGTSPSYTSATQTLSWPTMPTLTCSGVTGLTVLIRDAQANTLQTFTVNLSGFSVLAPTINQECDHSDTPATSSATWMTDAAAQVSPCYYMSLANRLLTSQRSRPLMILPGDVVRGIEAKLDLRVIAGLTSVPSTLFQTCPSYTSQATMQSHNLRFADGTGALGVYGSMRSSAVESCGLVSTASYPTTAASITGTDWTTGKSVAVANAWFMAPSCSAPSGKNYVTMLPTQNISGDWDTGPGLCPDGAMVNLPDAGTSLDPNTAYFSLAGGQLGAVTRFAPNALVPSPVIFGSLPAGINPLQPASSEPWRTLLFCPYPAGDALHPGFVSPPDDLLLDQFWMPTVEPYAISTCMATAGKINLNDQIAPFTYLHRNTALHALLHDLRVPAIPQSVGLQYKTSGSALTSIWNSVDENATITALESRFTSGDAYLTEGEICGVPLIPAGQTAATLDGFWNGSQGAGRLTGDNLRELPYAQLYSRLTTRSNSYTVHMHVQVLQKLRNDPNQNVWNEGTDVVLGDWRGSYEIERYLDPNATAPSAATGTTAGQQLGQYRFRIVSAQRFSP